ncbi:MAG: UDP-3-O-(3-hydroxymyristoyl)glucosamine N-acyltransferase [Leptospiraceae bacterium]|nr:UDP-3-O-(3-hydroxymyristoyl)glucosamine N-acyltransferase [Leptospiraceae bacterium]
MKITAKDLYGMFESSGIFERLIGSGDVEVTDIAPVEECSQSDLVFIGNKNYIRNLKGDPAVAVVSEDVLKKIGDPEYTVIVARNVNLAHAVIKQKFVDRDIRDEGWERVHPSAVVHESVRVPESTHIGPNAVVGRGVSLGDNVVIMANSVVEWGATVGDGTVIHPNVVLGYNCHVGRDCILKSGCVIGAEGFGFAQDAHGHNHRIPQTGNVVLGDRVVIGANDTIDRATYGTTLIKDRVVFDTLCHIGHNCEIGEDSIIISMTGISGSTKLGKRVICTGKTGMLDHLNIADDAVFLHRATVLTDIKEPGAYAGTPLLPLQTYFRNTKAIATAHEMKKRIQELEKKVEQLS